MWADGLLDDPLPCTGVTPYPQVDGDVPLSTLYYIGGEPCARAYDFGMSYDLKSMTGKVFSIVG